MDCYITYCIKGFLAFNDDNELNIGDHIFMDDIIDNIEDNEFNDLINIDYQHF